MQLKTAMCTLKFTNGTFINIVEMPNMFVWLTTVLGVNCFGVHTTYCILEMTITLDQNKIRT